MDVIVLGASAAYPRCGGACSGYLVRDRGTNLLIDCGTGVLSNLFRWLDPINLDAVVITHLHTDHFLDLYPLSYYYQYENRPDSPIKVLVPRHGKQHVLKLVSKESTDSFSQIFEFIPMSPGAPTSVGSVLLKPFHVPHFKDTYGLLVTGSKKIAYTSDCGIGAKSVMKKEALRADLLISEATLQEKIGLLEKGHLTAEQAGEIAAVAQAKKLLLTHIWASLDKNISSNQAEKIFGGPVLIAEENQKLVI